MNVTATFRDENSTVIRGKGGGGAFIRILPNQRVLKRASKTIDLKEIRALLLGLSTLYMQKHFV